MRPSADQRQLAVGGVLPRPRAECQLSAEPHTRSGSPCVYRPWEEIIKVATEEGCDLISMVSHGRSGVSALLLGSETTKVLTHSKIPVLVYR